jgi:hypothetical protein
MLVACVHWCSQATNIYITWYRKSLNIFERKVYRRILGPVCDNEKENWRILTNKEIYAIVKQPTITETIRLHRLCWFGHVQRMEENRISKRVLCMNLESTRPRETIEDHTSLSKLNTYMKGSMHITASFNSVLSLGRFPNPHSVPNSHFPLYYTPWP